MCSFIGAQAWVDVKAHGGRNPLVDAALELSIFGERSEAERELDEIRGPMVARDVKDDPRISPQAADPNKGVEASNPDGSFEAFFAMFGGGARPAMPGIGQQPQGGGG